MKKSVLFTMSVFFATLLLAQEEEAKNSRFFAGGNFGLSFGSYTIINLSPQVGYRFNRFASAGVGLNLQYASQKVRLNGLDYSKTSQGITGLNVFGRIYPAQNIFVQVQPEANYIFGRQTFYQPTEETYKMNAEIIPCFLVGGGIALPAGNGNVIATVLFDVVQKTNSPYGNRPFVNFGYNFPF